MATAATPVPEDSADGTTNSGGTNDRAMSTGRAPGFWRGWGALLRGGGRGLRGGGARLLAVMLAFHLVMLLLAFPLIGWLFREALRASGMIGLDLGGLRLTGGLGVSLLLILVIGVLLFWLAALQLTTVVLLLHRVRRGAPVSARTLVREVGRVSRKLLRPSSLMLALYLFLLLPLSGFGFASIITQGIAVPPFISGELLKSPGTAVAWNALMLLLAWLNLRFSAALPVFALTDANGGAALRASWRVTRGRAGWSLAAAVLTVLAVAGAATLALLVAALVPTAISDELNPAAAPVVAAFSLGAAQVLGAILTALVTAGCAAMLLTLLRGRRDALPDGLSVHEPEPEPDSAARVAATAAAPRPDRSGRAAMWVVVASAMVVALGLGANNVELMHRLSQHPQTAVLGHRGYTAGGVENTIEALEAADAAGADAVEMDVLQTADGRFVVLHDSNLSRLAGQDANVRDLTLAELTGITVRDSAGHSGTIPSLADYVARAEELGMTLLIEIKMGGLDTEDHVERLVRELEELGVFEHHLFHSLDRDSVERLKQLRPDSTVGYTMAFAAADMPRTSADFVVVEEATADQGLQDAAARTGLGFAVWTVNESDRQRTLLRRDVDAIITDQVDTAVDARSGMQQETGLADTLLDALTSFVVVF